MNFDDNYPDGPRTSELDGAGDRAWRSFLERLSPDDFDTSWITRAIEAHSSWLQTRPYIVTDILSRLLPGATIKAKDLPMMATFIGGFLFDAGYKPQYNNPDYPTWYWTGGAPTTPHLAA